MSDNIKKIDLSTPGRILDAGDIRRKKDKLSKTKEQLKNLDPSSKKYHRKAFKAEKTEGQIQSGRAGIQGFKMPYNMVKNNSAIKEVTTEEVRRVPEYLPPRRVIEPKIVDETYARNIQRNIEKHKRQDAMIEAERARDLERQLLERELKNSMKQYVKPIIVEPAINMLKNNSAAPYKLPHQRNAAPKQTVSSSGEVREIDNDSLAADKYYEKVFNKYMTAEKDPRFGPATEKDRWKEFLMENYSTKFDPKYGTKQPIEASNPEPGQDNFPSEADVQAVDPKFRIPERFSWEAYNKKFPRK